MSELSNSALCELYEIGIYRVGETFERYRCGEPIPDEDKDKWFVATPTGMFPTGEVAAIPLADTIEEAEGLAVRRLHLRELHQAVCDLGSQALWVRSFPDKAVTGIQFGNLPARRLAGIRRELS